MLEAIMLCFVYTVYANRRYYVHICDDHEDDIDTGIARKVCDVQICRSVKDPIEKLAQIANAIDKISCDLTLQAEFVGRRAQLST